MPSPWNVRGRVKDMLHLNKKSFPVPGSPLKTNTNDHPSETQNTVSLAENDPSSSLALAQGKPSSIVHYVAPAETVQHVAKLSAQEYPQPYSSRRDLWQAALESLDEHDRKQLVEFGTSSSPPSPPEDRACGEVDSIRKDVDSILDHANRMLKEEGNEKWKSALNGLLDGAQKVKDLVDAVLTFDVSGYGAAAWSVLSFGVGIAINNKEMREFVFQSSGFIAQLLSRYTGYELLYRGSTARISPTNKEKFEDSLVGVYKAVLEFVITMNVYLDQKGAVHMIHAFLPTEERTIASKKNAITEADSGIKELMVTLKAENDNESFANLENLIMRYLQPVYHLEERLKHIQSFTERQDREEVLKILPNVQQQTVHWDIRNKLKIENAGKWIIDMEAFDTWQNSKLSCGLWLCGTLGTGKTALMSTIIDHVNDLYRGTSQGAMAYYYCSGTATAKSKAHDILGNLLRQLASSDEGVDKLKIWQSQNSPTDLSIREIKGLLQELTKLNKTFQTTIIIDALDEVDWGNGSDFLDFMEILESLMSNPEALVKVLLSSRPEKYIRDVVAHSWPNIEITKELTSRDIESYIRNEVGKILRAKRIDDEPISEELISKVITSLINKAGGHFRYVEMAIKSICKPDDAHEIELQMNTLPEDLKGLYNQIFKRIKSDDLHSQQRAKRAISWVMGAPYKLHSKELIKALSSAYGTGDYKAKITVDGIISSCHNLMIHNKTSDLIEFGHFSVIEFLQEERPEGYDEESVHELMAFLCLNAMLEFTRGISSKLESEQVKNYVQSLTEGACDGSTTLGIGLSPLFPYEDIDSMSFWVYAVNFWAWHCERSGAESGMPKKWSTPLNSWRTLQPNIGKILYTPWSRNSVPRECIHRRLCRMSALEFDNFDEWMFLVSCAFGLVETVQELLQNCSSLAVTHFPPPNGCGGIHFAIFYEHLQIVRLICQNEGAIYFRYDDDTSYFTKFSDTLSFAFYWEKEESVEILLSYGASSAYKEEVAEIDDQEYDIDLKSNIRLRRRIEESKSRNLYDQCREVD